jgi:hypothetical protein
MKPQVHRLLEVPQASQGTPEADTWFEVAQLGPLAVPEPVVLLFQLAVLPEQRQGPFELGPPMALELSSRDSRYEHKEGARRTQFYTFPIETSHQQMIHQIQHLQLRSKDVLRRPSL